jgi:hypothetical protein
MPSLARREGEVSTCVPSADSCCLFECPGRGRTRYGIAPRRGCPMSPRAAPLSHRGRRDRSERRARRTIASARNHRTARGDDAGVDVARPSLERVPRRRGSWWRLSTSRQRRTGGRPRLRPMSVGALRKRSTDRKPTTARPGLDEGRGPFEGVRTFFARSVYISFVVAAWKEGRMGWLGAVGAVGMVALFAGTAQAGTIGERQSATALSGTSFGFVAVNAPVHRRCDFIHDPDCTGTWLPSPSKARRKATAAAPGDTEAPVPAELAASPAAAGCPPGRVVGTKGECVAPKPVSTDCPPGNLIGTKRECVKPLPVTIPEPATLPVVALGLGVALAFSRRRSSTRPR